MLTWFKSLFTKTESTSEKTELSLLGSVQPSKTVEIPTAAEFKLRVEKDLAYQAEMSLKWLISDITNTLVKEKHPLFDITANPLKFPIFFEPTEDQINTIKSIFEPRGYKISVGVEECYPSGLYRASKQLVSMSHVYVGY